MAFWEYTISIRFDKDMKRKEADKVAQYLSDKLSRFLDKAVGLRLGEPLLQANISYEKVDSYDNPDMFGLSGNEIQEEDDDNKA